MLVLSGKGPGAPEAAVASPGHSFPSTETFLKEERTQTGTRPSQVARWAGAERGLGLTCGLHLSALPQHSHAAHAGTRASHSCHQDKLAREAPSWARRSATGPSPAAHPLLPLLYAPAPPFHPHQTCRAPKLPEIRGVGSLHQPEDRLVTQRTCSSCCTGQADNPSFKGN